MTPVTEAGAGFDAQWTAFRRWASGTNRDGEKSSMWQGLIRDFEVHGDAPPADARACVFEPDAFRGYNFANASVATARVRGLGALVDATDVMVRALNLLRVRLLQQNMNGFGSSIVGGRAAGFRALRRAGREDAFRAFCRKHRFFEGSLNAMKAFHVASEVEPFLRGEGRAQVLEVGAGMGTLALVLLDRVPIARYTIVDLPEMLLNSSLSLRAIYPDATFVFLYPDGAGENAPPLPAASDRPVICLCAPDAARGIETSSCDLAINVDSFQEMTREQVQGYLSLVQRVVRPGGRLVNLNRRKFLERENFDNNPLMYPYASANRVLRWEVDAFMARTFNLSAGRIDGWILREEEIVK